MKIGFAILLDDDSHNYARKLELELCKRFGLCWGLKQSPHITIKPPFSVRRLEPFIDYAEDLAKKIRPFYVEIEGFDCFEPRVIFLDVKENPKLRNLHIRIIRDLKNRFGIKPQQPEGKNFKFHSTLAAVDVTKENIKKSKAYLKTITKLKFKFKAEKLGVFYYLGRDAGWIVIRKIKIGKR